MNPEADIPDTSTLLLLLYPTKLAACCPFDNSQASRWGSLTNAHALPLPQLLISSRTRKPPHLQFLTKRVPTAMSSNPPLRLKNAMWYLKSKTEWFEAGHEKCPTSHSLYVIVCLDRSNRGNARIAGMSGDPALVGNDYQWLLTIFYITLSLSPRLSCGRLFNLRCGLLSVCWLGNVCHVAG